MPMASEPRAATPTTQGGCAPLKQGGCGQEDHSHPVFLALCCRNEIPVEYS